MPPDVLLTPHFHLSQFTACPAAAQIGLRNEPFSHHIENLRRVAQLLEQVRAALGGATIHVLSAFRRSTDLVAVPDAVSEGRAVNFIAPAFGSPREICTHLHAVGAYSDRLVCAPDFVHMEVPPRGGEPRRQLQTAVFVPGRPLHFQEGLL